MIVLVSTTDLRGVIGFSSFGVLLYYFVANVSAYSQRGVWTGCIRSGCKRSARLVVSFWWSHFRGSRLFPGGQVWFWPVVGTGGYD